MFLGAWLVEDGLICRSMQVKASIDLRMKVVDTKAVAWPCDREATAKGSEEDI
jgi:hypothetical protein